ncbi:MAG: tRNA (adenosine(37)-N6)-threonylcarbamoyltransferase complex dimerization subunit type 1 TsaB [Saprospiraceae bacterium]|nr:tRNA (adenosine(37)-N6)-threonylcarbamoyltransferase complex dimerization subunit type 1 TsaB [Saprospiraceae bacterium]MCB9321636.1 tRNA (adenosine(37)-N6)-threonylcarbamoyltransferase complex dimerization subunit type 1 TsaB [Lewinellaceae bacterium]
MIAAEDQPVLLHLETAEQGCSVALSRGNTLIYTSADPLSFRHTSQLPLLIKDAMEDQQMDWTQIKAVAICDGPGSYTALRVGASMAKAICYAHHIPLIAVPTLDLIYGAMDTGSPEAIYVATLDARRERVFYALYDASGNCLEGPDLSRIDALIQRIASQEVRAGGSGVINQPELWIHPDNVIRLDPVRYSAAEMTGPALQRFARGMFEDLSTYAPNYLLRPNITTPRQAR